MILYCDTSALLKLYVSEAESGAVHSLVDSASAIFTHEIAYVELMAAVGKARRVGRVADSDLESLIEDIEVDWASIIVVGAQRALIQRAGRLALELGLRGYDSLHLAAAEHVVSQACGVAEVYFVVFDEGLRQAAGRLAIALKP